MLPMVAQFCVAYGSPIKYLMLLISNGICCTLKFNITWLIHDLKEVEWILKEYDWKDLFELKCGKDYNKRHGVYWISCLCKIS